MGRKPIRRNLWGETMMRLWNIQYDAPCSFSKDTPIVIMQCDREPTESEAETAIYNAYYTGGTVYVGSITETSESEMRGKKYYLVGAK